MFHHLKNYAKGVDSATGVSRGVKHASTVMGALSPMQSTSVVGESGWQDFVQGINASRPVDTPFGIGTVAGAAAGGYLLRKTHPVLGVIGGGLAAKNVPALLNPSLRGLAVRNLLTHGSGIAGSLYIGKKGDLVRQIGGYIVGAIVGGSVAYLSGVSKE